MWMRQRTTCHNTLVHSCLNHRCICCHSNWVFPRALAVRVKLSDHLFIYRRVNSVVLSGLKNTSKNLWCMHQRSPFHPSAILLMLWSLRFIIIVVLSLSLLQQDGIPESLRIKGEFPFLFIRFPPWHVMHRPRAGEAQGRGVMEATAWLKLGLTRSLKDSRV